MCTRAHVQGHAFVCARHGGRGGENFWGGVLLREPSPQEFDGVFVIQQNGDIVNPIYKNYQCLGVCERKINYRFRELPKNE